MNEACFKCEKDEGFRSTANMSQISGPNGKNAGHIVAASVSHNMNIPTYRSNISVFTESMSMQNAELMALQEEQKTKQRLIEKQ